MKDRPQVKPEDYPVRSILMRLYRSRISGEAFYPGRFVNGEAPTMEADGWIERRGDGWRITATGIRVWAEMSAPVMNNKWRNSWQNELQWVLGKPFMRLKLEQTATIILKALVENGGSLPLKIVEDISRYKHADEEEVIGLSTLMNGVYVINDGEMVEMTEIGWEMAKEINIQIETNDRG